MMKYNISDIIATEGIYLEMRPLMRNHPYMGPEERNRKQCPACGSLKTSTLQPRRTKVYKVIRQRCDVCATGFELRREKIA
jgi:hypothetical protein